MENIYNLSATLQKSYYGKAKVIETETETALKSYDTIVCKVVNGEFIRLWGGYSRTTMNHVNDFRALFGLPSLTKREWESLPCDNGNRYRVQFSNGFVSWKTEVVFDNEDDAETFADEVARSRDYCVSGWVIPA